MREWDRMECMALGRDPKAALRGGVWHSRLCWTALVDGRPEAMFGLSVASAIEGRGVPWMLGTDEIYRHGKELMLYGPALVAYMTDSTPILENLVSSGNHRAIRLLSRWGFTVEDEEHVFGGLPFRYFRMNRHVSSTGSAIDRGHGGQCGRDGLLCNSS
jgi:ribosomal protein S18 acetylase RimI-like enzyme